MVGGLSEKCKCKAAGLCERRSCNRATETGPGASVEGGRYISARISTPLLPDTQIILGSLNIDIVSHTSQDKKAARNQERLIIFARTIIWYSFAHRCAAEHPKNHEMSMALDNAYSNQASI